MKKNSLTKLLALALCAVMALGLFAGCASKSAEETAETGTAAETTEAAAETTTEEAAAAEEASSEESSSEEAASTEESDGLLAKIKASGKLVVGTEAQYAPYEFKDLDANFAGCDIWLAQQIADSLGVELEVVDMAFDFSDLYETSAQLLIVKTGNADKYSTKEALAGQKVGAQKGTIQSQLIVSALPDSELFELEKYPALALETQNGNIAGFVVDQAVGEALVATSDGQLEVSNFQFTAEEASFGKAAVIAKGNEDFVAAVNEVIDKVVSDGSYQKAYDDAVELAASLGL